MTSEIEYSLDIRALSKSFKRQTLVRSGYTTLKSALLGGAWTWLQRVCGQGGVESDRHTVTKAVQNLTIRVPKGSSLGIIGRNGSGKSTLLKLITGIYKPDSGSVRVRGRLAALIELGAGFHPDFTGRENLLLGGVMHGLSRAELEARIPDIVEFAELRDVIDDPVRTYSSGMFMRLGFSLAVHTDPDILIIDEVLAVGDAAFTSKCKERIAGLRREGKTLLLVSHDLDAVERWCDEVVWLDRGVVADRGNPRRVIDHYRESIERGEEQELRDIAAHAQAPLAVEDQEQSSPSQGAVSSQATSPQDISQRWGSREIEIVSVRLRGASGEDHLLFHSDDELHVAIEYNVRDREQVSSSDLVFGIGITRSDGILVHGTNTEIDRASSALFERAQLANKGVIEYSIQRVALLEGNYRLDVAVHRKDGYPYDYRQGVLTFAVRSTRTQVGVFSPEASWSVGSIEQRTAEQRTVEQKSVGKADAHMRVNG